MHYTQEMLLPFITWPGSKPSCLDDNTAKEFCETLNKIESATGPMSINECSGKNFSLGFGHFVLNNMRKHNMIETKAGWTDRAPWTIKPMEEWLNSEQAHDAFMDERRQR